MGDIGKVKRILIVEPLPDDLTIPDVVPATTPEPALVPEREEETVEPARS